MSSAVQAIDASEFPIKSVTVFKSNKAEVVRTFTLQLEGGENRIEITNLSSSVDTKSARVSGLGGAARLLDVVCTIVKSAAPFEQNETLRLLQLKRSSLVAEKLVIDQETDLLLGYGRSLTGEHVPIDQMSDFLKSFRKEKLSSVAALANLDERIHEIDKAISGETEKETKGRSNGKVTVILHAENDSTVSLRLTYIVSNAKWDPVYDLHASAEETKSVVLHYRAHVVQTTGEDWKDTELTLSTTTAQSNSIPRLGIYKIKQGRHSYKPFINNNVPAQSSLFGSSVAQQVPQGSAFGAFGSAPLYQAQTNTFGGQSGPGFGGAQQFQGGLFGGVPQQQQQQQAVVQQQYAPQQQYAQQQQFAQQQIAQQAPSVGPFSFGTRAVDRERDREREVAPPPQWSGSLEDLAAELGGVNLEGEGSPVAIVEGTATVRNNPLSASFQVQGLANIPSDGEAHTVSIASSLNFEAVVTRVAVPRLSTQVHLQCRVKNVSEYRLLPGNVSIFLDEGYVSKSVIGDVSPGEGFVCTIGIDSSVRVSYERTSEITHETARAFGDAGKDVTTYASRTTIRNKHPFAVTRLVLRDALPLVGEDDKSFKVTLKEPEGLIDASEDEAITIKDTSEKWKDSKLKRKVKWGTVGNGKGGEKDGKYEWLAPLEAGQEVTLVAVWEIRASRGTAWYETIENA